MLALCQSWLPANNFVFAGALWTPAPVPDFTAYWSLPDVTARWAEPMRAYGTVCRDLTWSQRILGCVPINCHSWGHSQQRIVLHSRLLVQKGH